MREFPAFMKEAGYPIDKAQQNTGDIEGCYFEGAAGQMAFWTCHKARESKKHTHDFDEYMAVVSGEFTLATREGETVLKAGDEAFIPRGVAQWGRCIAGTRTLHVFGGKRIKNNGRGGRMPEGQNA